MDHLRLLYQLLLAQLHDEVLPVMKRKQLLLNPIKFYSLDLTWSMKNLTQTFKLKLVLKELFTQ